MPEVADLLDTLRSRGARVTEARRVILDALLAADGHVTAEDLVDIVGRGAPNVHRSTVYRCLETLEDLGLIEHVHLGHGAAVYHLAEHAHHHLVCEGCGTVVEVPAAAFAALAERMRRDHGFRVQVRHFAIPGRCRNCVP